MLKFIPKKIAMLKTSIPSHLLILFIIPLFSSCVGYNTITKSELVSNPSTFVNSSYMKGWKDIPVYEDDELLLDPYRVVAKINVTGNQNSLDKKLIKKMQQEASRYNADAVIFKNWKEVERNSVNGLAIGLNIISAVSGGYADLDMGGDYIAYEYEGIAIQFLKKKKVKLDKKEANH